MFSGILEKSTINTEENTTTFYYSQKIPVPTYLIAFVCGDLEFGKISSRCGVYTERGLLQKALYEFAETEKFIKAAEEYINPYIWGEYNILVLPFAFAFGGMENPCLTFVNPALLAGDRSLTNVIAHEIAHSWTGNLVTNKNWTNFWMNEGFTTFLERKISEICYGEDISNLEAQVGMIELEHDMELMGKEHSFSSLNPDLKNVNIFYLFIINFQVDPNDAFSVVPYEKGYCLLKFIENLIGKKNFQLIFQAYIEKFTKKSICYQDYIEIFEGKIREIYKDEEKIQEIFGKIKWQEWIHKTGALIEKLDFRKFF